MTIAREEIFGPVLAILPYDNEEEAIAIANDTPYGLSGYVSSGDLDHARRVASRLRTGNVHLNGAQAAFDAPFGGYKQSGNGREWGVYGFEEFLETKAVLGYAAKNDRFQISDVQISDWSSALIVVNSELTSEFRWISDWILKSEIINRIYGLPCR